MQDMIEMDVRENTEVTLELRKFKVAIQQEPDGSIKVQIKDGHGMMREMSLSHLQPLETKQHPRDVWINQNLTEARMPTEIFTLAPNTLVRIVAWEQDPDTGSRSVLDIVEVTRKTLPRVFNNFRKGWMSHSGIHPMARLEIAPVY